MALSDVQALITAVQANADEALETALNLAEAAQTYAGSTITSLGTVPSPTEPDIEVPPFISATEDLGNEFKTRYDNVLADLQSALDTELSGYITTFFPGITTCFVTYKDWLCDQIENGGSGINAVVEAALFQRGRDRLGKDQSTAEAEIVDGYAARGWNMPAPVLTELTSRSRQDLAGKVSEFNRDMTIQQFEAEKEMTKFAIEQFGTLYHFALEARNQLMDLFIKTYEAATRHADAYVDAKRRLWEGVAAYYNALINAAGLTLEYDKIRINSAIEQNRYFVQAYIGQLEARSSTAVGAANAAGNVAAAYGGAQNALAEVAHVTEATE